MKNTLTQARLKELLSYDPDTGEFRWRIHRQCVRAGSVAGADHKPANSEDLIYRRLRVDGAQYYAHRLAWLYQFGDWPSFDIDHANGDGRDNRISNLRQATVSQNMANMTKRKRSNAGAKGVTRVVKGRSVRYRARVRVDSRLLHLGYFNTVAAASRAAADGRRKYFGEFAR